VTLPYFYFDSENYPYQELHPYNFGYSDLLSILIPISLYLLIVNAIYYVFQLLFGANYKNNNISYENLKVQNNTLWIILIVALLIPCNIAMYNYGISIAGITPPNLPFRISGILHYLTKYIIPFGLAYLYWRGKQDNLALVALTFYAYILGLTTISRSIPISILAPIILLSLYKKEKIKTAFSMLNMLLIFMITTQIRNDIYTISNNELTILKENSPFENLFNIFRNNNNFISLESLLETVNLIFNRIEGFQNLVFSISYNAGLVAEPFVFIIRMIWWGFGGYSSDNHNIEWIGTLLPDGFVLGGACFLMP
jgi:hypothetical protein